MTPTALPRPIGSQPHYGRHLGDPDYWSPYVRHVLERHGFAQRRIEETFVGTFPTFLSGDVVVKLFSDLFDGAGSSGVELAMAELLAGAEDVPAPRVLASGRLFDDEAGWHWPYLVTERAAGTAIREWDTPPERVAEQLGRAIRQLHALPAPDAVTSRDLLPRLRRTALERLRGFGMPDHLLAQVPEFLADAAQDRVLVHADLTADHLFVDANGLRSIIDWGDALWADPWYELAAVFYDGLRCDRVLFQRFLAAAGWSRGDDFARRALQGVLEFQFDAIGAISRQVDLARVPTLDHLADLVYDN